MEGPDPTGTGDEAEVPLRPLPRHALRRLRRSAGRATGEPLRQEDWAVLWELEHSRSNRAVQRVLRSLPGDPRCRICGAPFGGAGGRAARSLGFRPSRKNPHFCATCVELSPPGGATMPTGVLFADVRGFTAASHDARPEDVARTLRRFYGCAERSLFPEAIIDKLIGDEVMALYLQPMVPDRDLPVLMVEQAEALLRAVGYGGSAAPFVDVGVGIDYGEAFVGNIGDRDVYDFTAVGDVVNTAARLQGCAAGGEIVVSHRAVAASSLDAGAAVEVELKGMPDPVAAHRVVV